MRLIPMGFYHRGGMGFTRGGIWLTRSARSMANGTFASLTLWLGHCVRSAADGRGIFPIKRPQGASHLL